MKRMIAILTISLLLLSGCGTASSPPSPTATLVPPTDTPERTHTPVPTSTPQPTDTPIPTDTPTPIPVPTQTPEHPANLFLATEKRDQIGATMDAEALFTVPRMDDVRIASVHYKDHIYKETVLAELTMEVYYPPDFDFESKLPVVIFVNGFNDPDLYAPLKDLGQYIYWGQLTAASGMAAINYETRDFKADGAGVLRYLRENSDWLGIDHTNIILWSCSGNTYAALRILCEEKYQQDLRGFVLYYGDVTERQWTLPQAVPLFVVKAGKDDPRLNSRLDEFVAAAHSGDIPTEFIDYVEGDHAFDVSQGDDQSRDIVEQTLEFMKRNLLEE